MPDDRRDIKSKPICHIDSLFPIFLLPIANLCHRIVPLFDDISMTLQTNQGIDFPSNLQYCHRTQHEELNSNCNI